MNLRALDELDDVFTRRFFFFDSVSGYVCNLRLRVLRVLTGREPSCVRGDVAQLPWAVCFSLAYQGQIDDHTGTAI